MNVDDRGTYFAGGSGESALLAFAGSLGACPTLVKVLSEAAPDHRIIAPDYTPAGSIAEVMNGVESMLAEEAIRPDILYGGSFGGMLAQSWLRRHPEEVRHAIFSGCGAPDPQRAKSNRKWLTRLPWIPMGLMRAGLRFALRRMMRDVVRDREAWRADYLELITVLNREDLASRYNVSIDFDENSQWTPQDLHRWAGKILILEGGADRVAGPKVRESLQALYPQATVHVVAGAGHALLLSHTEQIQNVVRAWLNQPG